MNMFCDFSFLGGKKGKILEEAKSPKQGKTHPKKKSICVTCKSTKPNLSLFMILSTTTKK